MKSLAHLLLTMAAVHSWAAASESSSGTPQVAAPTPGRISVHDPVMIREDGTYYVFATGQGIAVWSSKDMLHWIREKPVFAEPPAWALEAVPSFRGHIWAPDISCHFGTYYLYYSVSAFGKNTSCIGLTTNATLNPADPRFKWIDQGKVLESVPGVDNWNAIDPNLVTDETGAPYLVFGSFWSGLQLAKLTPDRLHLEKTYPIMTIASRNPVPAPEKAPGPQGYPAFAGENAIEAPFIFKRRGWYYLFASTDYCCRGPRSNYKMIVGRARFLAGPYIDKEGAPMAHGGGTLLLAGDTRWYGVGHNAVCTFDGVDYLIFHGYDAQDRARPKLRIEKLSWDKDGWPSVQLPTRDPQKTGDSTK